MRTHINLLSLGAFTTAHAPLEYEQQELPLSRSDGIPSSTIVDGRIPHHLASAWVGDAHDDEQQRALCRAPGFQPDFSFQKK